MRIWLLKKVSMNFSLSISILIICREETNFWIPRLHMIKKVEVNHYFHLPFSLILLSLLTTPSVGRGFARCSLSGSLRVLLSHRVSKCYQSLSKKQLIRLLLSVNNWESSLSHSSHSSCKEISRQVRDSTWRRSFPLSHRITVTIRYGSGVLYHQSVITKSCWPSMIHYQWKKEALDSSVLRLSRQFLRLCTDSKLEK